MSMITSDQQLPSVEIVVISWQGFGERSRRLARQLCGLPEVRLRVIYSNASEAPETGAGEWHQVPNAHYFGLKFSAALAGFDSDVLLLVQADALCADWPALVARCQMRFAQRPRLGMWAPRIDFTPWLASRVDIRCLPGEGITQVAQTDGVVLAISRETVQRLKALDYSNNNIGWGIDWAAICYCYTHGLEVLREDGQLVAHPPSRGYDYRPAVSQWLTFMRQLSEPEQAMFEILKRYTAERRRGLVGKLMLRLTKWRSRRAADRLEQATLQHSMAHGTGSAR